MQKKPEHSTIVRVVNFEDDIHCMPQDDWFEHMPDANCPCNPILDEKNKVDILRGLAHKYVWVHNQIKYNKQEMN